MSCAVALPTSPAFSSVARFPGTKSLLCKSASFSSNPRTDKTAGKTTMSCSVAVPTSPVFSPVARLSVTKSLLYKSASFSSNPRTDKTAGKTTMSCAVAVPTSPAARFLASKSLLCKSASFNSNPSNSSSFRSQKPFSVPESDNTGTRDATECTTSARTILKRKKRPAKLEIPAVSTNFGDFPASPSAAQSFVEVEGDGYSVCCKRGRRHAMEDRYSALVNFQGDHKEGIFGVFDGHGGAKAAEFAAENLNKNIIDELVRKKDEDIVEALKDGYLKTDSQFLDQELKGGSCCVTALIRNKNLVVSNAGDCRAVVSRGGVSEALTLDHKPSRKDEKDRIVNLGGYVDCCNGTWRIQGSLAVSRGIGDRSLKHFVIAEPETNVLELNPELEFLVLASDGLWDKVNNQEVVDAARPLCTGIVKPQPLLGCKKLIDLAVSRGSVDDISVMIIQLQQFC